MTPIPTDNATNNAIKLIFFIISPSKNYYLF